jgi:hypothetical protein
MKGTLAKEFPPRPGLPRRIYSWYARSEWKPEGNSIPEDIGNNHELGNIVGFRPDGQYQITDAEMLPVLFALVEEEGFDTESLNRD